MQPMIRESFMKSKRREMGVAMDVYAMFESSTTFSTGEIH
jgi:hypothetical protein